MPSLRDIDRRRKSVKNTQKITRAMKMVAAAKLRRAQEAIVRARPYAHHMRALVNNLASRAELDAHPLLRRSDGKNKVTLILVTSDRGLCGGFNSSLVNAVMAAIENEFAGRDVVVTVVGRKGFELLKRRRCAIGPTYTNVFEGSVFESAKTIIGEAAAEFVDGGTDDVYCLYNEFKSAIAQRVTLEKLLPFEVTTVEEVAPIDYLYEPDVPTVFQTLFSKHMGIQMHRILFESAASEHGARMTAMDAATTNAEEMIDRLTLLYNRARQDTITKELIEVISGAEAL